MAHEQLIESTMSFVKRELRDAEGGHDWFHIERVYKNAMHIAASEGGDLLTIQLAALLHDIADSKFHNGDEEKGPAVAKQFMTGQDIPENVIQHVVDIIRNISFKGGNFDRSFNSLELDIVQDADRLDAIGAIGIARAFNYGGFKNRQLYNPKKEVRLNMSKDQYKKSDSPTINHFYEKLLLLKDRMRTATGRVLAAERHLFMEQFLDQFYQEWSPGRHQ